MHPSDPLGHEGTVTCLVASPNSKWIVTGSHDGTIIIWDAESGEVIQEWLAHCCRVHTLSFSPDSSQLVSAGSSLETLYTDVDTLVVWDISNGVVRAAILASPEIKGSTKVLGCAWSPDGTLIASLSQDRTVHVWDAFTFQQCGLLSSQKDSDTSTKYAESERVQWSPDSHYLAWSYRITKEDRALEEWVIWSPLVAEQLPKRHPLHPRLLYDFDTTAFSFDPKSRYIAVQAIESGSHTDKDHSICVEIWDIESDTLLVSLPGHTTRGQGYISFSQDGTSLLSHSKNGPMKIWDTESWQETASLKGDGMWSYSEVRFSPDGQYVATAPKIPDTGTYTVQLWRISDASCVAVFTEHKTYIEYLAFSPNGEFLASGDKEGIVHIRRLSDFIQY